MSVLACRGAVAKPQGGCSLWSCWASACFLICLAGSNELASLVTCRGEPYTWVVGFQDPLWGLRSFSGLARGRVKPGAWGGRQGTGGCGRGSTSVSAAGMRIFTWSMPELVVQVAWAGVAQFIQPILLPPGPSRRHDSVTTPMSAVPRWDTCDGCCRLRSVLPILMRSVLWGILGDRAWCVSLRECTQVARPW